MTLPRFYPIIDSGSLAKAGIAWEDMAVALAEAGVQIAQFRHKGPYTRRAYAQAKEVGRVLQQAGIPYILNDRADIALMLRAEGIAVAGVHVGQDDLPPQQVRGLAGDSLFVGFSTHTENQLREGDKQPVDYLAIGPVFGTRSKEKPDPVVGVEELRRLRPFTKKPLVAIGGITRGNAREVLEAGADAVAVISDLIAGNIEGRIAQWMEATS